MDVLLHHSVFFLVQSTDASYDVNICLHLVLVVLYSQGEGFVQCIHF